GAVVVVSLLIDQRAIVVAGRIGGIEPDCFVVVGEGAIILAFLGEDEASDSVGAGVFEIELERPVHVGQGPFVIVLVRVVERAVGIQHRIRRDANGLAIVGDGAIGVALALVAPGAKIVGARKIEAAELTGRDYPAAGADRRVGRALLIEAN